jgi:hypothetical protein
MMDFKEFLNEQESEEKKNIDQTIGKLPKSHAALIRGYKWKFQGGNTLDRDNQHIGVVDDNKKLITVAAPWNYGREFTALHEIGHKVWEKFVTPELRKEWSRIAKKNKNRLKQNDEELFAMAYANNYAHNRIEVHTCPEWDKFIEKLPS